MPNDTALGMLARGLHHAHGQSGGTRCDDRIRGGRIVHVGEQLYLEVLAFGTVLLNKVGVRERLLHIGGELQMLARCVRREPDRGKVFPGGINVSTQVCLRRSAPGPSR